MGEFSVISGAHHIVDSSDWAFHQAAEGAMRDGNNPLNTNHSKFLDPGAASSIPARSHTFMEIDHEIISTVILLPYAESFKKGCCQLQEKVCARSTG